MIFFFFHKAETHFESLLLFARRFRLVSSDNPSDRSYQSLLWLFPVANQTRAVSRN